MKEKLLEIEKQEQVRILLAVESGSRAWGFASPDSDFDVRFIYVRKQADYLRLDAVPDVIEWQLDDVLDINGWDLRKTLTQFYRGNAGIFEWANSPVVYRKTALWDWIYERVKAYFSKKAAVYHYYGTAKSTFQKFLQGERVSCKKYFYALRPLLACRYIEEYKTAPPVLFSELLKMDLQEDVRRGIEELLQVKKVTGEKEEGLHVPVVWDFIQGELKRQEEIVEQMTDDRVRNWDILNEVFLEVLERV